MADVLGYEIFLPCRLFAVEVEFDDHQGISPIEELFLDALKAGITNIQTLLEIFQLGERPLIDLIYDLWRRSYVSVDVAGRRVLITPAMASKLGSEAKLKELRGGQHMRRAVPLLQDAVIGAIFPVRGARRYPGASSRTVPAALSALRLADVRPEAIVAAVEASVGDPRLALGDRRIIRTHLAKGEVADWGTMRWLPLRVDCTRDSATEQLRFAVLDTGLLDGHSRWQLEGELGRMSESLAVNYFFRQISERARPAEEPRRLREILAEFVDRLGGDIDEDRGLIGQAHDRLRELAREAIAARTELEERWSQVTVLAGHEALETRVRTLFRTAQRQVVIACPFVQFDPLNEIYWDVLTEALERGVQVFLLWGIKAGAPLDERVRSAFGSLAHEYSRNLFIARRSTRTHAKFVIRDEAEAVVTSYNFLDPSARETFELGVSVQGPLPDVAPGFVQRLLQWARAAFPDYVVAQGIRWGFTEADAAAMPAIEGDRPPSIPQSPAVRGSGVDGVAEEVERASIQVWRRAWQEESARLAQGIARIGETAHLVIDGDHPSLLWQALRTASRRLVLMSDRLTTDVVKGHFEDALRALLGRGVDILVVYRRADDRVPDGQERPDALLSRLQAQHPMQFKLIHTESHAKVLLWDDRAIVSSFNFLSHEGNYGAGPALQRRRERSEIGVELEGPAVEAVAGALRRVLGDLRALAPLGRAAAMPSPAETRAPTHDRAVALQPLLTSLLPRSEESADEGGAPTRDPMSRLTAWFAAAKAADAWADLDALATLLGRGDLLRMAAAACFGARPIGEQPEAEARWRGRLARWAWDERRYYDAMLLLGSGAGPDGDLPRWLAELASLEPGSAAFGEVLSHLMAAPPAEAALADAAAVLLVQTLLLHGDVDSADVLEQITLTCSAPFQALNAEAIAFFRETHSALALQDLALLAQARSQNADQEALAARVLKEIEQAAGMRFRFDSGRLTWNYLFREGGAMDRLRQHAQRNDVASARGWRKQLLSRYRTVESLMDESTRECGVELIAHKKRPPCLDALQRIVDAADRWIDQPSVSPHALPRLTSEPALRRLSRAVVAFGTVLGSNPAGPSAAPAAAFIEATKMMGGLI